MRKLGLKTVAVTTAGVLGALLLLLISRRDLPDLGPLPNPNGYDLFRQAAREMIPVPLDYRELSTTELSSVLESNRPALVTLRKGLAMDCKVPVEFSEAWLTMTNHSRDLVNSKKLARLLDASASLALKQAKTNEAIATSLDAVRFGHAICRGGVAIDAAVATACEAAGLYAITNLLANLDRNSCAEIAVALENLELKRESAADVFRHEEIWSRRSFNLAYRIRDMITKRSLSPSRDALGAAERLYCQRIRFARGVMVRVAARAYGLDHGQPVQKIESLVPGYLRRVPVDPKDGKPLGLKIMTVDNKEKETDLILLIQ
jgi:hypothetical protein